MPAPRRPGRGDAAVADAPLDALIVGAGPTGLALAVQLRGFGVRFRIVDRLLDRARESRALAIQARTLEVLDGVGLGERLAAAGRTSTRLMLHFGARVAEAELGGFRVAGTRYPFILFLSQAETERILNEHLAAAGVRVERGVELVGFRAGDVAVECTLRHGDGREERVRAAYLVGCDGAHSTVRKGAGIPFEGGTYLQDFALGDVEADGPLARDTIHSFAGRGVAMFFPLGSPTTWRVIAMAPDGAGAAREAPVTSGLPLDELQAMVDGATGGTVRLHDPAWLTHFRLHHRQTARYRAGRVFLAGDAAHIHSPVGAQGMNTGIQDAWNLGWKLALVARGRAGDALLDTYEAERWPVGHALLRTTDRVFGLFTRAMSAGAAAAWFRRTVVARVLPRVLRSTRLRAFAFGFVSQLRIRYRASPLAAEGSPAPGRGPKAGDRLPDAPVVRDGRATHLQKELAGPCLHLLLCGEPDRWDRARLAELTARYGGLVRVDGLVRGDGGGGALVDGAPGALVDRTGDARTDGARGALIDGAANAPVDGSGGAIDGSGRVIDGAGGARTDGTLGTLVDGAPGALVDRTGEAFERLGVDDAALYLVRPDGYIGFRSAGYELQGVGEYLARWFRACAPDGT